MLTVATPVSTAAVLKSQPFSVLQVPPVHTALRQSESDKHSLLSAQSAQVPPPAVDVRLEVVRHAVRARGRADAAGAGATPRSRSPVLQALPVAHLRQAAPQSTSVSAPFFTVSEHEGA
jgi:hypothetical protein